MTADNRKPGTGNKRPETGKPAARPGALKSTAKPHSAPASRPAAAPVSGKAPKGKPGITIDATAKPFSTPAGKPASAPKAAPQAAQKPGRKPTPSPSRPAQTPTARSATSSPSAANKPFQGQQRKSVEPVEIIAPEDTPARQKASFISETAVDATPVESSPTQRQSGKTGPSKQPASRGIKHPYRPETERAGTKQQAGGRSNPSQSAPGIGKPQQPRVETPPIQSDIRLERRANPRTRTQADAMKIGSSGQQKQSKPGAQAGQQGAQKQPRSEPPQERHHLPAGPPRPRASLNAKSKAPSIGGLIHSMQAQPSNRPYHVAAGGSLAWLFIGLLLGWVLIGQSANDFSSFGSVISTPSVYILAATVIVPIALFWFIALLIWRSQEMKLMASAMTEVAIRLAEPDKMAEQKVASVGQTIRRQVTAMDDAISRALGRAGELESLVHNEVAALERSYSQNEFIIRNRCRNW
jgi:hypothetical protein